MSGLLLALVLQDPTIPKQDRSTYLPVLERFREAEAALGVDALDCARRCKELIDDKAIKATYREARVRLQNTDGSYGEWTLFVPFQLRGRALMLLAKAASGPEAADLAVGAVEMLEKSMSLGMKASAPYLEQARTLAESLKPSAPPPDPRLLEAEKVMQGLRLKGEPEEILRRCDAAASLIKGLVYEREWNLIREGALAARAQNFQKAWTEPLEAERFGDALKIVELRGGFLPEAERESVRARIRTRGLDRFVAQLKETLVPGRAWVGLAALDPAELERRFSLPEDAAFDWARRCKAGLGKPALVDVRRLAVEAADKEPRAFEPLEALAYDLARAAVEALLAGVETATSEEVKTRRGEARAVVDAFALFEKDLPEPIRARHGFLAVHARDLEAALLRFPLESPQVNRLVDSLFDPAGPVWGDSPFAALEAVEKELREADRSEGTRLTRDARRTLATGLLVARATRLLLGGRSVEEMASDEGLQEIARGLRALGGAHADTIKRSGPKLRSVAERLSGRP